MANFVFMHSFSSICVCLPISCRQCVYVYVKTCSDHLLTQTQGNVCNVVICTQTSPKSQNTFHQRCVFCVVLFAPCTFYMYCRLTCIKIQFVFLLTNHFTHMSVIKWLRYLQKRPHWCSVWWVSFPQQLAEQWLNCCCRHAAAGMTRVFHLPSDWTEVRDFVHTCNVINYLLCTSKQCSVFL